MRHFFLILLTICSFLFCACSNEKDASDIQIIITPDSLAFHVETGDKLLFSIDAKSLKEPLSRIQINQKTAKTGLILVWDSIVNIQKFNFNYQYTVPNSIFEKSIELSFVARTASDYSITTKYLIIDSINTPLKESSAHVMYSFVNKSNNAFSITQRQVVSFPLDSLLSDFYDYNNGLSPVSKLSCEWRSATSKRFSRFNDFNYAEATVQSLQTTYENASRKTAISELKVNDIILIGGVSNAIGVVKIIAIYDEAGSENDRYLFNVKYIE